MTEPTDEEIALALDQFLEATVPAEVPSCIHVEADMISTHHGSSLESGEEMLMLKFTAKHANDDGTYTEMVFGLDQEAAVALLFAVHEQGTEIWGEEEDDDVLLG